MAKTHACARRGALQLVRNPINLGLWVMAKRFRRARRPLRYSPRREFVAMWWWCRVRPRIDPERER